jgi:glycosyltransferase involved in cell wall biosynthesis
MSAMSQNVAVVLPCYRSRAQVMDVITRIGPGVFLIVVVDDACPEGTGDYVAASSNDRRVLVVRNKINLGVGGAVLNGYRIALERGADIVVKIDSDGQMDPALLPQIVNPIRERLADYTKGNRFFNVEDVRSMPPLRLFGNAALSFLTKLSSGYWTVFDPTNGYTAIHRSALELLPLKKIDHRFFFESDMLFRLYLAGAVVVDVPMRAVYGEERSQLNVRKVILRFALKNIVNTGKRINIGSLELVAGIVLLLFGMTFGAKAWIAGAETGVTASAGTVMLAGLPVLVGVQLILGFFAFDVAAVPRTPLQSLLGAAFPASLHDESHDSPDGCDTKPGLPVVVADGAPSIQSRLQDQELEDTVGRLGSRSSSRR